MARLASFASAGALAGALLVAPTAHANGCIFANFGGGTGTSSDPLLVVTADHLNELKDDSNCWGYEFLQTADISMGGATWTTSIGGNFTGTYDGSGHAVSDLTVTRTSNSYVGLFGTVTSTGTVRNLSFHGSVTGVSYVGGLAGINRGTIAHSFVGNSSRVTATSNYPGGLVGINEGTIENSFSAGAVDSPTWGAGLVASNNGGTVTNSYSTSAVSGTQKRGLIAINPGTVNSSYWDTESSGVPTSAAGTGKTTEEMQTRSTFSSWSIEEGWDATATWGICSAVNSGYPFLTAFYSADPCTSNPSASTSSARTTYQFTFWLPDGRQCTAISPITVAAGTSYELPGADAACAVTGSEVTGWRIPGQLAAFAPGRRVQVSGSQQFTAVLEYSWVDVVFDANVASLDQCLSDGNDSTMRDASWSVPRELLLAGEIPVPESAPCTPPGHSLIGWSTEPTGNRTPLSTLPAPAVDTDGNAANSVRLYAIWSAS